VNTTLKPQDGEKIGKVGELKGPGHIPPILQYNIVPKTKTTQHRRNRTKKKRKENLHKVFNNVENTRKKQILMQAANFN